MDTASKIKVLVVDDEKDFADEIASLIKSEGAEVTTLYSGDQAAATARDQGIDLVLLDIRMPGKDGLTTLEEIKEASPETEIFFLTAFQETHLGLAAAERGASHFLVKPIQPRELIKTFQTAARFILANRALAGRIEQHNEDYQKYQGSLAKLERLFREKCRLRQILRLEEVETVLLEDFETIKELNQAQVTAILVDDEIDMTNSIAEILKSLPHLRILPTYTLKEAEFKIEQLAKTPAEPVVIFLDVRLPDGNGLDFLTRQKKSHPQMEVIIVTAYHDAPTALQAIQRGAAYFIAKPFGMEEIMQIAESTVNYVRARKYLDKLCRLEEEALWPIHQQQLKLRQLYKEKLFSNELLTEQEVSDL